MIRTLVIDDSPTICRVFTDALKLSSDIEVIGSAPDAFSGLEAILALQPDVITLDIEMPHMDGLTFLTRLMRARPMPVVVVSTLTTRGSSEAMRALELGAVEVLCKPTCPGEARDFPAALSRVIHAAAIARVPARQAARGPREATPTTGVSYILPLAGSAPRGAVLAIGASTGGTEAVRQVLSALPADAPATLIVQHLPQQFTRSFAERLDEVSALRVAEAVGGEELTPGTAWVAPGGRHLTVVRQGGALRLRLGDEVAEHFQRPSVDVLFRSVAAAVGARAVGALLTGMGKDGAEGLLAMRRAGGRTLAQDQNTSVVYGMPREAIERGAAERACPLGDVARAALAAFAAMER